jgi:hypothetical protein
MSSSAVPGIKNAKVRLARKTGVGPDRLALSCCIDDAVTGEKLRANSSSRSLTRQETQPDNGCCYRKFAEILMACVSHFFLRMVDLRSTAHQVAAPKNFRLAFRIAIGS